MAIWPLSFTIGSNASLPDFQKELINNIDTVSDFLKSHGLSENDFTVQAPNITDTSFGTYGYDKPKYRYIAKQQILIRSKNVKAVKTAQEHSLDLTTSNIALNQDYDAQIVYEFTDLNSIKPEMIGEATKNARAAAEKFASDSGSSVGKIRTASQGYFSIENAAIGLEEKKKVRVVTYLTYYLDN